MGTADDHTLFFRSDVVVAAAGARGTAKIEGVATIPRGQTGFVLVLSHAYAKGRLDCECGVLWLYDGGCGGGSDENEVWKDGRNKHQVLKASLFLRA